MASFQYATTSGALKSFDAPDQATAMRQLSTFADRDPSTGIHMLTPPAGTTTTPTQPSGAGTTTPTATPTDYGKVADAAGAAGLGVADLSKLFGPTSDEQTAAKDKIAQQFGYKDSADFYNTVFAKPTQTTTD